MSGHAAACGSFSQVSERLLGIDVDGGVWLKPGAAVAYRGAVGFARRATLDARSASDAALRELSPLVRAAGRGRLYCAQHGAHVRILQLSGETLFVVWQELLAFEESLAFKPTFVAHGLGLAAGGLIAIELSGHGALAIATHGETLTLPVSQADPLTTDPHATVAWTGGLAPRMRTDLSWRSLVRHGGQEPVQMYFDGEGAVVVQPYEDPRRVNFGIKPLDELKMLIAG